jgi:predicted aspartyl protease
MTPLAVRSPLWRVLLAAPLLVGATPGPATPSQPPPREAPAAPAATPPLDPALLIENVVPFVQPFDLDATRRMSVPVMVAGQGPFSFLVDTGAERTIIARELADRLGLGRSERLRLATIGTTIAVAPSFRVASLEMTDLRLNPFDAPAFAGRHIGAAGLIGVDMLEKRRLLIDFRNEKMEILATRRHARPLIRDKDAIVVSARNSAGRLILSDARIDGRRVDVVIDTGAQSSVGNLALQKMITARRQNSTAFYPTILGAVTGEDVPAMRTFIKRIEIEGININDLPVSFADSRAFAALGLDERPALLLGMDSLSLFDRVEIDFPNKRVVLDMPSGARRETGQRFAFAGWTRGG